MIQNPWKKKWITKQKEFALFLMQIQNVWSVGMNKPDSIYEGPQDIPLEKIDLDEYNLRFRHMESEMTQQQIEDYLYDEEDVRVLQKQILKDRQVYQPIYVQQKGDRYVVKEGNRRCVACLRIQKDIKKGKNKDFDPEHFSSLKAFILTGSERDIDFFLGSVHISGPKEWARINKANHIYNLIEEHNETMQSVAEELGITKGTVEGMYLAFRATAKYGKKYGGKFINKFPYFDEFYRQKSLREFVKDDPSNLDSFSDLVAESKFNFHRGVRKFAKIIKAENPQKAQALSILQSERGNIESAYKVIEDNSKSGSWSEIFKALKALKEFPHESLKAAVSDVEKIKSLAELIVVATGLQQTIQEMQQKGIITP